MREPSDSAAAGAEILERSGVRWALAGALAAQRYRSTLRATTDADFLADSVEDVVAAFEAAGYSTQLFRDEDDPAHLLVARGHGGRIDVMAALVDYQQVALERARDRVLTVEDVIVHKLIAWRPQDRDDILSILEVGHDLDEHYLREWAAVWDVTDRWEQARRAR